MTEPASLVVVGASLAGLRAIEAARKDGFEGALTLVGAEPHLPYDRPPLSKAFLEAEADPEVPQFRDEQTLKGELGVDLRLGAPATGLDTEARVLHVGTEQIAYDALVIATGARARTLPGADALRGVLSLRSLDDAHAIRHAITEARNVVVIGAGFIGSEVASSAHKRGRKVTILEQQPVPLVRAVGEALGKECAELHAAHGVDLRCGVGVSSIEGDGVVEAVCLDDGSTLDADLVVVGIGAVPATEWLASSGLRLDDGVACDQTLWTGAPGVYAAGDVARWHNPAFDREMRLEHWTSAAEQGALAARNALDPANSTAYSTVPYFWSDWYGNRLQFVGIPAADRVEIVLRDDRGLVALYAEGDRLVGALTRNRPRFIMKLRRLIAEGASWSDGVELVTP